MTSQHGGHPPLAPRAPRDAGPRAPPRQPGPRPSARARRCLCCGRASSSSEGCSLLPWRLLMLHGSSRASSHFRVNAHGHTHNLIIKQSRSEKAEVEK